MSVHVCKTTYRERFLLPSDRNEWDYTGEMVEILPPNNSEDKNFYLTQNGLLFQGDNLVDSPNEFIFFDFSTGQIYQVTTNPHRVVHCRYN